MLHYIFVLNRGEIALIRLEFFNLCQELSMWKNPALFHISRDAVRCIDALVLTFCFFRRCIPVLGRNHISLWPLFKTRRHYSLSLRSFQSLEFWVLLCCPDEVSVLILFRKSGISVAWNWAMFNFVEVRTSRARSISAKYSWTFLLLLLRFLSSLENGWFISLTGMLRHLRLPHILRRVDLIYLVSIDRALLSLARSSAHLWEPQV